MLERVHHGLLSSLVLEPSSSVGIDGPLCKVVRSSAGCAFQDVVSASPLEFPNRKTYQRRAIPIPACKISAISGGSMDVEVRRGVLTKMT